jgi:REP element-mobilizing transposase RayT
MAGTYSNILLHLVFSTKHRRPLINADLRRRLYDYLGGIIRGEEGVLYEIGGTPDHVHLLIRWRPNRTISDLLRDLKSQTSTWIHETFAEHRHFEWQGGYGVFSVSASRVESVKAYIRGQEEHHRRQTFQEEFLEFLQRNGVEYDERYIWE